MKPAFSVLLLSLAALGPAAAHAAASTSPDSLLSSPAFAAICADGVTAHPRKANFWHIDRPRFARSETSLFATMELRPNDRGQFAVVRVDRAAPQAWTEVARFREPVRDLAFRDGRLYVLLRNKLLGLDPVTGEAAVEAATFGDRAPSIAPSEDESAQAMAWIGGRLLIAHGTLGVTAYEPGANTVRSLSPLALVQGTAQSKATDVRPLSDGRAVFAIEGLTVSSHGPGAFNGLAVMNADGSIERFGYDEKTSGVLSMARLLAVGERVYINNWGILQHVDLATIRRTKGVKGVAHTPIRFDVDGSRESGQLLGDLLLDDNGDLVACAETQKLDAESHRVVHRGVVYRAAR